MTTQIKLKLPEKEDSLNCENPSKKSAKGKVTVITVGQETLAEPKPFILSDKFKELLISVKDQHENLTEIVDAFLNKEFVGPDGLNYIGISEEDNTKISYLDAPRIEKFEGVKDPYYVISKTPSIVYSYQTVNKMFWDSEPEIVSQADLSLKLSKANFYLLKQNGSRVDYEPVRIQLNEGVEVPKDQYLKLEDFKFSLPRTDDSLVIVNATENHAITIKLNEEGNFVAKMKGNSQISDLKFKLTKKYDLKVWSGKARYHSTVGKLIRKVFGDRFSDKEVSTFTDAFREFTMIGIPGYTYAEVRGEKIKENYHVNNYHSLEGDLGRSCMRQPEKQHFMNLYAQAECCELATLYFQKKVAARCLLWTNENGKFRDRIYAMDETSKAIIKNLTNRYKSVYDDSNLRSNRFHVPFSIVKELSHGPYMDSLPYYDVENECLTGKTPSGNYLKFQNQYGEIDRSNYTQTCPNCGTNHRNNQVTTDNGEEGCVYCTTNTSRGIAFTSELVRCDFGDWDYAYEDDTIMLVSGHRVHHDTPGIYEYENAYGYFTKRKSEYEESVHGLYYHPEDPNRPSNLERLAAEQAEREEMERLQQIIQEAEQTHEITIEEEEEESF